MLNFGKILCSAKRSTNYFGAPNNECFGFCCSSTGLPPPPYAVFSADGTNVLNTIAGLTYVQSSGPSADSILFNLLASGLSPSSGNITITPDADFTSNFQIFNPNTSAYTNSTFTIAYSGGVKNLPGFKVRLKSGLSVASYSGILTITSPNTTPFILTASGSVTANMFIVATGGTVTTNGNFKIHEFYSSDDFIVSINNNNQSVDVLVQAGGGGGGFVFTSDGGSGGGGAGGQIYITGYNLSTPTGTFPASVGAGGAGGLSYSGGTNGSNSTFDSLTAIGGGGGTFNNTGSINGNNGGSGGGCAHATTQASGMGGAGVLGQGNRGGNANSDGFVPGSGGGGAGAQGQDLPSSQHSGSNGGDGLQINITGTPTYYGGGGGGGADEANAGTGGLGGGADGSGQNNLYSVNNGIVNSGGGGGGGGSFGIINGIGGNGGSGVIIIKYQFQ